jgi:ubiquinone/menaquinone biosynthesis C-methylase UbiE
MNKIKNTNPDTFIKIARGVFAPIYPVLAKQIISKTGIQHGTAIDLGSGPGGLGIALANLTKMKVILYDISSKMLSYAEEDIAKYKLENRVTTLKGDVCFISVDDDSMNLVISRGSLFFWENLTESFKEIERILAPGGMAYIGGGFGSSELEKKIALSHEITPPKFIAPGKEKLYEAELKKAKIDNYNIIRNDSGMWIVFKKTHYNKE